LHAALKRFARRPGAAVCAVTQTTLDAPPSPRRG